MNARTQSHSYKTLVKFDLIAVCNSSKSFTQLFRPFLNFTFPIIFKFFAGFYENCGITSI